MDPEEDDDMFSDHVMTAEQLARGQEEEATRLCRWEARIEASHDESLDTQTDEDDTADEAMANGKLSIWYG